MPGDRPDAPLPPQAATHGTLSPFSVTHGIGGAVMMLKLGMRVARTGWNGKGMYLFRVEGGWTFTDGRNDNDPTCAFIAMRTVQGAVIPWLASQADLLAEDWIEVQP